MLIQTTTTTRARTPHVCSFKTRLGSNVSSCLPSLSQKIRTSNPHAVMSTTTTTSGEKPVEMTNKPKQQQQQQQPLIDDCGDKLKLSSVRDPLKDIYPSVVNEFKSNLLKFEMLNKCTKPEVKLDISQLVKRFFVDCKCGSKKDCEKMIDSNELDKIIDCLKGCKCNKPNKEENNETVIKLKSKTSKSVADCNLKRRSFKSQQRKPSSSFLTSILNTSGGSKLRSLIKI